MTQPMGLDELVRRMGKLVAMSPVRARLLQCLAQESPEITTLTELVESDPVIAARTLRVANSPFFGLSHEIESIAHAVSLVGLRSLQAMALAAAVMEQFKTSDPRSAVCPPGPLAPQRGRRRVHPGAGPQGPAAGGCGFHRWSIE